MILFIEINLMLIVAYAFWLVLDRVSLKSLRPTAFLKLSKVLVGAAVALPVLASYFPVSYLVEPAIEVWSEPARASASIGSGAHSMAVAHAVVGSNAQAWGSLSWIERVALALLLLSAVVVVARIFQSARSIRRILRSSHLVRSIGKVRIFIHDADLVPFSFWIPGRAYAVIPASYLENQTRYRITVLHELQHHRQGDTRTAYLFQLLKIVFPAAYFIDRAIAELQEFACDEALVSSKSVSPQAYGGCLVEAAESMVVMLAGTTGMAAGTQLKRRIKMMFDYRMKKVSSKSAVVLGTLAMALMASAAWAGQSLVRDRRVTLEDAQKMAASATNSAMPIVVNDQVVEQLSFFVGTPGGRKHMRESLERMSKYKAMISEKIGAYNVPEEILAVPIIESGYQNIKRASRSHGSVAGLWMFIETTARHYNLRVTGKFDDRMNEELETDAAMRLLSADFLRFQDWHLALLAYNAGENYVQKGIERTGARSAWKIIETAKYSEREYLSKLMAVILIMKNPSLLN